MKKLLLCIIYLLFSLSCVKAQSDKTIWYNSEEEKKTLQQISSLTEADGLRIMLMNATETDPVLFPKVKPRLDEILKESKKIVRKQKDHTKQLLELSNYLKGNVLLNAVSVSGFDKLILKGISNPVSAAALYRMILVNAEVPFTLKEGFYGLAFTVYPEQEAFEINLLTLSTEYKHSIELLQSDFLSFTEEDSIITNSEKTKVHPDERFSRHFFQHEIKSYKELKAIEYIYNGIENIRKGEIRKSIDNFQKSLLIETNPRALYYLKNVIENYLVSAEFSKEETYSLIILYANLYSKNKKTIPKIVRSFMLGMDPFAHNEMTYVAADSIYKTFMLDLKSARLKNKIRSIFLTSYTLRLLHLEQHNEALNAIEQSYQADTSSAWAREVLAYALLRKIAKETYSFEKADSVITDYQKKYPYMYKDSVIMNYKTVSLYEKAYISFTQNEITKGLEFLEKADDLRKKGGADIEEEIIGYAYGEGAAAYWRLGKKKECIETLEKGLKICPANEEMNRKKRVFTQGK